MVFSFLIAHSPQQPFLHLTAHNRFFYSYSPIKQSLRKPKKTTSTMDNTGRAK
jgi:hypothetical protein